MEKINKPLRQFDDGVSLGGRRERSGKVDKNRVREMKRAGEVLPVEQSLPAEPIVEEHPQEPVVEEVVPEVAPQEEKMPEMPESPKVSELAEIYGDKTPPASVEELFNKLKGKKREEYVVMLRGRMAEEAQKKSARSQRPQKKAQREPNGFSRAEIDAIAQETLDQINDFKAGVDVSETYAPQVWTGRACAS